MSKNAHAWLQQQFFADEIEFCLLSVIECCCTPPVAARIRHGGIEHGLVQVVAQIVVMLPYHKCFARRLVVDQACAKDRPPNTGTPFHLRRKICREHPREELIQLRSVPPAVHVRLAECQRSSAQHTEEKTFIRDLDVPRLWAVHGNIRQRQQMLNSPTGVHGSILMSILSCYCKHTSSIVVLLRFNPSPQRKGIQLPYQKTGVLQRVWVFCKGFVLFRSLGQMAEQYFRNLRNTKGLFAMDNNP